MLTSLVSLQQGNVKKSEKLREIANTEEENLHIFWTSWGIGKNVTYDNSKCHKKQGLTFSFKNTFLEKPQGAQAFLGLRFKNKLIKLLVWGIFLAITTLAKCHDKVFASFFDYPVIVFSYTLIVHTSVLS